MQCQNIVVSLWQKRSISPRPDNSGSNQTEMTYQYAFGSLRNQFDALNRLTNRLDGLGQTKYTYAVPGNGMRRFCEDGPWANDDVIVTNRYGLRSALAIAQPTGQFLVTNSWDATGRWQTVGGTAGTFTYAYPADTASSLPISITLPGGGYITNQYDSLARLTRTELRTSGGSILNAYGYQYNLAHQRTLIGRTNSALSTYNGYITAEYDPAGQLVKAWTYKPDGTPVTSQKWSYGYDHENRLTGVATDTSYTPEYNRFRIEFKYDAQGRMRIKKEYVWSSQYYWWTLNTETRYVYDQLFFSGAQQ